MLKIIEGIMLGFVIGSVFVLIVWVVSDKND